MKIKNIDDYLENSFIPHNIIYKKVHNGNTSDETIFEKYIPLYKILRLKISNEDKEYMINRLKDMGIVIKGQIGSTDFESDNYLGVKCFRGGIPKSLSKEETLEKFELFQKNHDPSIRNEIILGNMELVVKVLKSIHYDYHLNQYDLLQAGYIGLIKAVDIYNPDKGAFSTIAVPYIEGYIKLEIYTSKGVKKSESAVYRIMKIVENECCEKIANNPNIAKKVVDVLIDEGIRCYYDENIRRVLLMNTVSLDEVLENNEDEILYNIGYEVDDSPLNSMYEEELSTIINDQIKTLKQKKQKMLEMRFGINNNCEHTLRELGEEFNMTYYGASINIDSSLEELRRRNKVRSLKPYLYKEI